MLCFSFTLRIVLYSSLVEATFNLTCNLFMRGNVYDTNFIADIDHIVILAYAGYAASLTQKRTDGNDKGEGPFGTSVNSSNKCECEEEDKENENDNTALPKIARVD